MPPTTVGVCPEMSATTRMASTRRRVSSPTSRTCGVPALPDTSPPFRRVPVVEDLATAADVLSEVERDEQRRGERSFPNGPSRGVDPALADLGNRRHTHGDTDLTRGGSDTHERAGAPEDRVRGDEEVGGLVGAGSDRRAIHRRRKRVRQRPADSALDVVEAQLERLVDRPPPRLGCTGQAHALAGPHVRNAPEQLRRRPVGRSLDEGATNRPTSELFWSVVDVWSGKRVSLAGAPEPGRGPVNEALQLGFDDVEGTVGWALTDTLAAAVYGAPVAAS